MLTINKKTMLIGWVIGLGSGLFISGIILSILLFTSNKFEAKQLAPTSIENIEMEKLESKESVDDKEPEEASIDAEHMEEPVIEEDNNIQAMDLQVLEPQTIEIEIEIGATATAKQIAKLLEEQGVIPDSDEFLTYIISQNVTRGLMHGTKIFPLNSDNESALKILTSYK